MEALILTGMFPRESSFKSIIAITYEGQPVCTIQCAIPHLEAVLKLSELPIRQIREEKLEHVQEEGIVFVRFTILSKYLQHVMKINRCRQKPELIGIKEKER